MSPAAELQIFCTIFWSILIGNTCRILKIAMLHHLVMNGFIGPSVFSDGSCHLRQIYQFVSVATSEVLVYLITIPIPQDFRLALGDCVSRSIPILRMDVGPLLATCTVYSHNLKKCRYFLGKAQSYFP